MNIIYFWAVDFSFAIMFSNLLWLSLSLNSKPTIPATIIQKLKRKFNAQYINWNNQVDYSNYKKLKKIRN